MAAHAPAAAVSARYWVMVGDDLIDAQPQWPAMLRPVRRGGTIWPGLRWWLFEDDDAPENLDGKEVDLTFGTVYGVGLVVERRVIGSTSE
jgi:hypothetical protein